MNDPFDRRISAMPMARTLSGDETIPLVQVWDPPPTPTNVIIKINDLINFLPHNKVTVVDSFDSKVSSSTIKFTSDDNSIFFDLGDDTATATLHVTVPDVSTENNISLDTYDTGVTVPAGFDGQFNFSAFAVEWQNNHVIIDSGDGRWIISDDIEGVPAYHTVHVNAVWTAPIDTGAILSLYIVPHGSTPDAPRQFRIDLLVATALASGQLSSSLSCVLFMPLNTGFGVGVTNTSSSDVVANVIVQCDRNAKSVP